jgi:ferredoxin-NADP reductase
MIAVGVGIAPMIQALNDLLDEENNDTTKIVLLYGVRNVKDILLR